MLDGSGVPVEDLQREHERARRGGGVGGHDTAGTIFCDQSILTLLLPPIITSASEFPGGKSKTSRVGMSWECAVQWENGLEIARKSLQHA